MMVRGSAEQQMAIKQRADRVMAEYDALPREHRELCSEFGYTAFMRPGETVAEARQRCIADQRYKQEIKLNEVLQR